jgi:hypothetical protein
MSSVNNIFQQNLLNCYNSNNYRNSSNTYRNSSSNSSSNVFANHNTSYGLNLMYTPNYESNNIYYNSDGPIDKCSTGNVVFINNLPDSFVKNH